MNCAHLTHPFQNDAGVSQQARAAAELLSAAPKIDGRTLADLLDYFQQLSRNVNFYQYDEDSGKLVIGDWQPFFQKSLPFILTGIIKYNPNPITKQLEKYNKLFARRTSAKSLQLIVHFIYHKTISPINNWSQQLQNSELPVQGLLKKLIKDKLTGPVKQFICLANTAADEFKIKSPNFTKLARNSDWQLQQSDLLKKSGCFTSTETVRRKRLIALHKTIVDLVPLFLESIRVAGTAAGLGINASIEPVKEELKEKHPPHLALLFAFLKLFGHLQDDLNRFTRKHLEFFYTEVLKLKAKNAVPDKTHILLEIQTQLSNHSLEKGKRLKAGKDENKAEMAFTLDDEIVINQAKVADVKTLFLNNRIVNDTSYVEGVYMAPDALKADGLKIDFKEDPKSWPTVGARLSKFVNPEHKFLTPYPNGRIGFALASPVLLLKEGTRIIHVTLLCKVQEDVCKNVFGDPAISKKSCCEGADQSQDNSNESAQGKFVTLSTEFIAGLNAALNTTYRRITTELLQEAVKKGLGTTMATAIRTTLLADPAEKLCYCPLEKRKHEAVLSIQDWNNFTFNTWKGNKTPVADSIKHSDGVILKEIFKEQRIFNIWLSGEKEWIAPQHIKSIKLVPLPDGKTYAFKFTLTLAPLEPPVTFFNAEILKEQLDTKLPVMKFELNDAIKTALTPKKPADPKHKCCLLKNEDKTTFNISFYDFFRSLVLESDPKKTGKTRIHVNVSGLKNLIVQNTETLLDVNKPLVIFGIRPKVGSSFYIGSHEIFSKNWQELKLRAIWKDPPLDFDFKEHYKYYVKPLPPINNASFFTKSAVLEEGAWIKDGRKRLFKNKTHPDREKFFFKYERTAFNNAYNSTYKRMEPDPEGLLPLTVNSTYGFLRLTLDKNDFRHDQFAYVLMKQSMALVKLVDPDSINTAREVGLKIKDISDQLLIRIPLINAEVAIIQNTINNTIHQLTHVDPTPALNGLDVLAAQLNTELNDAKTKLLAGNTAAGLLHVQNAIQIFGWMKNIIGPAATPNTLINDSGKIHMAISAIHYFINNDPNPLPDQYDLVAGGVKDLSEGLGELAKQLETALKLDQDLEAGLPKEPYTPTIIDFSVDYEAIAKIDDIDLIHLHPFKDTYQTVQIQAGPTLFPTFCNEGHLFLGLDKFIPGSTLSILFKLAEATADSEAPEQDVLWHYLHNNVWKPLRNGLEILKDETDDLTTSGIIKFALPQNMTTGNTIVPPKYHWIRASIQKNSGAVAETLGIFPQAVGATFVPDAENNLLRLAKPLVAGTISRLEDADPAIKLLTQPHDSFGGQVPEKENNFYVRVAELLRHKGRAIQRWDYERLALEAFPEVFKAKCITHSFGLNAHKYVNDFPLAPGYVLLAVIPDLNKLNAAKSFQPKLPVSILLKIEDHLKKRTSPFVRLKAMNPRYEEVDFCIKAKLIAGSDPVHYKEVLVQELREFMAPWAVGEYQKLRFGQCINRSDIIQFLESRQYLDHILELKMALRQSPAVDFSKLPINIFEVCPLTPRSILIAGDIDVCIPEPACDEYSDAQPCTNKPYNLCPVKQP